MSRVTCHVSNIPVPKIRQLDLSDSPITSRSYLALVSDSIIPKTLPSVSVK